MRDAITADQQRSYLEKAVSLPDLFRQVAALRGTAEAIRDNGRTLSYRELDLVSDRLAAKLVAEGFDRATGWGSSCTVRPRSRFPSSPS